MAISVTINISVL